MAHPVIRVEPSDVGTLLDSGVVRCEMHYASSDGLVITGRVKLVLTDQALGRRVATAFQSVRIAEEASA